MIKIIFALLACAVSAEGKETNTKSTTITFLGDSLTEGFGVSSDEAFPAIVGKSLTQKGKVVRVINAGISGSTSASGPSRMKWALKANPNWVVLALGANDGLRGLEVSEMKNNLVSTIKIAQDAGVKVLLAGMRVPPNFGADYGKKFEKVFRDIARENKAIVFVPFLLDRVGGEKDLNLPDGIHPNAKGHQIMADLIFNAIEPKL